MKWNEKDAIRGHSVDRYRYAVQLVHENTDEGLVKAFAWLSLAADEVDVRANANLIKHKVGFELKKRCIFQNALILEQSYRDRYSGEALRKKIAKSKNPVYVFLRVCLRLIEGLTKVIDTIDRMLFKEK